MSIGEKIKKLRKGKNMNQEELGKILNVGKSTISQYENNINKPDTDTLKMIADFFNTSVDYILGRTDIKYSIEKTEDNLIVSEDKEIFSISKEIQELTPESQEDLKKYIELLKIKDMKNRNKSDTEMADEISK